MSSPDFKIVYAKNEGDNTYWVQIGVAFKRDKGGYTLKFNSMPMIRYWDGRMFLFPWEERDNEERSTRPEPKQYPDDLPF